MIEWDQRADQLESLLASARQAIDDMPADQGGQHEAVRRLRAVLDFVAQSSRGTAFMLVPDDAWTDLSNTVQNVGSWAAERPSTLPDRAAQATSALLRSVVFLPSFRGRWRQATASKVVAEVRDEADRQLGSIRKTLEALEQSSVEVAAALDSTRQSVDADFSQREAQLEATFNELRQAIAAERQRLEAALTDQSERFRRAEDERANTAKEMVERIGLDFDRLKEHATDQAEDLVTDLQASAEKARELLDLVTISVTADRYGKEAVEQEGRANSWRWTAMLAAVLAVGVGFWTTLSGNDEGGIDENALVGRVLIALALGGVAVYAAKQSARHRDREELAKATQLDLAAFGPFIDELEDPTLKDRERVDLGRRVFGQRSVSAGAGSAEGGPVAGNQIIETIRQLLASNPPGGPPGSAGAP